MTRRIVVYCLGALAAVLLGVLVLESRSMGVDGHLAHYESLTRIERASEDYSALMVTLADAWENLKDPGENARALATRVASSPERIMERSGAVPGGPSQVARLNNSVAAYGAAVEQSSELIESVITELAEYSVAVSYLRENGTTLVEQLREIRLNREAEETFQLLVGTLDYAKASATVRPNELKLLLATLARDERIDANIPNEMQELQKAVSAILGLKPQIESKLRQLGESPVPNRASAVSAAQQALYRNSIDAADQAKTLLAVYAILLLMAAGFIAVRLNQSYRQLNTANADLAAVNDSLELRVEERTEELSSALSELKESQVQLVQAEKMSSLGQLVAGISHEINTPLLYLANNAVLLQERVEVAKEFAGKALAAFSIRPEDFSDRNQYQAEFVGALKSMKQHLAEAEIEDCLSEAESLVSDSIEGLEDLTQMAQGLKDFSRLDRAPVDEFNVNDGLEKTLLIAKNALKYKVNVHKHYGEVPMVECSPSKINQVFLNLITNGAQAIEEQGDIVITTSQYDDDHVAIAISDTGCGIPEENLIKIRDPFFTTKEVGSGTGLGLSIVDEIVRSHSGRLEIDSEVGKGSTFTLILPIKYTEPEGEIEATQTDATESVEDTPVEHDNELAEAV